MNKLPSERTPQVIAAEITTITHQTRKILLASAVEIGRRLNEAKALIPHGEWIKWLEESVNYSSKTAQRMMRLYEEYGNSLTNQEGKAKEDPESQLSYSQALLLLGLPAEEREEFLANNEVGGMSKSQTEQLLKERDQARQEKEQALQQKAEAIQASEALKKGFESIDKMIDEIKKERAKEQATELLQGVALQKAEPETEGTAKTAATAQTAESAQSAKSAQSVSPANQTALPTHNLATERDPNAAEKYVTQCDTCRQRIADIFFEMTTALTHLNHIDPELKEEKRIESQKLMVTLAESINEWPPTPKPLQRIR